MTARIRRSSNGTDSVRAIYGVVGMPLTRRPAARLRGRYGYNVVEGYQQLDELLTRIG